MAFLLLHTLTVFSSLPIIIGDVLQRSTAVAIDQLGTDGELFVKRIVHGEKITDNPGYLLFTAPLKLCKGSCEDSESNFAMAFPIYIGKKGKQKYKKLYDRDYKKLHTKNPDAPFKKRPTKKLFTLCPRKVIKEQITKQITKSETTLTETLTIYPTTQMRMYSVTETPESESSTNSETETTAIDTTIEIATSTSTTPTIVSETLVIETATILTIETLTVSVRGMPATDALTTNIIESTETKKTTAKSNSKLRTTTDQTEMLKTEAPKYSTTETFESFEIENQRATPLTKSTIAEKTRKPKTKSSEDQSELFITEKQKFFVTEDITLESFENSNQSAIQTRKPKSKTADQTEMFIIETPKFFVTATQGITFESYTDDDNNFEIPVTKVTTATKTNKLKTKKTTDHIEIFTTKEPKFSVTETEEDIDDFLNTDNFDTNFVTNAQGYRCPPRICRKKSKPKIVIIRNNKEKRNFGTNNAQWNSDYSDLRDSSYL